MNLLSELLCWIWLCSSMRPCCCKPKSPPTRFGRRSSDMLLWSMNFCWLQLPAEKFNWRLKIAGKMLNCCESGETGLSPRDDVVLFTKLLPLAAVQLCLKSNVNARVILILNKSPGRESETRNPSEKMSVKRFLFCFPSLWGLWMIAKMFFLSQNYFPFTFCLTLLS